MRSAMPPLVASIGSMVYVRPCSGRADPGVPVVMWSYKEIEHAADRAFRVRGHDQAELFTNAALALAACKLRLATKPVRLNATLKSPA